MQATTDEFTFEDGPMSPTGHIADVNKMVPHKAVAMAVHVAQATPDIINWWDKLDNFLGGTGA
jgi:hypothetical protein